jgi:hypothetical protein
LRAQSLDIEPTRASLGRVDRVVLEGLVHGASGGQYMVGGRTLTLSSTVQITGNPERAFTVNQRVRVTGSTGPDQRVTVDRIEVRSDSDRRGRGQSGRREGRNGPSGSGSDDSGKSGSGKSGSDSSGSSG